MPYKDLEKRKAYAQSYRDGHRDETKTYNKQYRQENKERLVARAQEYVAEHRERVIKYRHEYNATHKEETKRYNSSHYSNHREQRKAYQRAYYREHKASRNLYNQQYAEEHHPEIIAYHREYNPTYQRNIKMRVLVHYSANPPFCARCGFNETIDGLTIDHINGGGNIHRSSLSTSHFYAWLEQQGFPTGYQVLCGACQFVKRNLNNEHPYKHLLAQNQRQSQDLGKQHRQKERALVIDHYSDSTRVCATCGNTEYEALSIDHIDGNGANHKKETGVRSGSSFYHWLIKNNFPEGYQCICMRCQLIKRATNHEVRKPKSPDRTALAIPETTHKITNNEL